MPEPRGQVPHHVHGGGREVRHGDPEVGGALLGLHRLVEVAEQVGGVLGVGPGVQRLAPQVVVLVVRGIVLVGHDQRPVQVPQIVHGGGLAQPVGRHELPELLVDVIDQLVVPPSRVLALEAEWKMVKVKNHKFLGYPQESFDSVHRLVQGVLLHKVMDQPKLLRGVIVVTNPQVEISEMWFL